MSTVHTSVIYRRQENVTSSSEFMDESANIIQNIQYLRSNWQHLERAYKTINKQQIPSRLQIKSLQNLQAQTDKTIVSTKSDLQKLEIFIRRPNSNKKEKLLLEKFTAEFQTIVKHYNEVHKQMIALLKQLPNETSSEAVSRVQSVVLRDVKLLHVEYRKSLEFDLIRVQDIENQVTDLHSIVVKLNEIVEEQAVAVGSFM